MKQIKTKPFSAIRSVVQRGTVAILCTLLSCLTFFAGCKKDEPNGVKKPVYPMDVPFTEYSLPKTCQWKNLNYDNSVIIINNDKEFQQHITSIDGIYPEIDFTTHTLLVASGKTDNSISEISIINLLHLSEKEYELSVEINLKMVEVVKEWKVAILVEKVSEESKVSLKISIIEPELTLKGNTWKLVGFVDAETGEINEVETINCYSCFLLEFNTDSTFLTFSSANMLEGRYIVDYKTLSFQVIDFGGEKIGESDENGNLYCSVMWDIQSFSLQKTKLQLFYNNKKNYLIFTSIEPSLLTDTKWKLIGFENIETGEVKIPEPIGKDYFLLSFNNSLAFDGFTSNNQFTGRYRIKGDETLDKMSIRTRITSTTSFDDSHDGKIYFDAIGKVHEFSLEKNELKLFYPLFPFNDSTYCLIFNKI